MFKVARLPVNKFVQLCCAEWTQNEERGATVETALATNERQTSVKVWVICRTQGQQLCDPPSNVRKFPMSDIPSMRRLAMRTTVSLIPRSAVAFLRAPISAASSASCLFSSSRSPRSTPSRGDAGGGASQRRMKSTNTEGSNSICLRTHIGAMIPSGYSGDDGFRGESGERGVALAESGVPVPDEETNFRGGNLTVLDDPTRIHA